MPQPVQASQAAIDANIINSVHRSFIGFSLRAEKTNETVLLDTFVDTAPLIDVMTTSNNQIVYGRRGTGKTHALKVVSEVVQSKGDVAIFVDLRSIGSNTSIYNDLSRSFTSRASQLINDVLQSILGSLYVLSYNALEWHKNPEQITLRLDDFQQALTAVRIKGSKEVEVTNSSVATEKASGGISVGNNGLSASVKSEVNSAGTASSKSRESGVEILHVDFANIQSSLDGLIQVLNINKLWLLVDEWSEIPLELQPYLADLFRRTCLPVNKVVLKIAAIEHRSNFNIRYSRGEYIGFEVGADISANLNLDDFLVFESDEQKSINFFKSLIYNHYKNSDNVHPSISSADQLIQVAFTQQNVFAEFVRAVEGVPRDALNLAATIATKTFGSKIAMADVGEAARDWYQRDKLSPIRSDAELISTLNLIIDEVIGGRRARAFLFSNRSKHRIIEDLFDARLLHVLKKNISSKDEPGERYDVYKIDYGCYIDLKNTSSETLGLLQDDTGNFVDVPKDDYRSIRRAVLRTDLLGQ